MSVYRAIAEDTLGFRSRPRQPPEALAELRDRRVRRIVAHAARAVPFYRRKFAEAGLDAREIGGADDLWRIPCISKEELRTVPLRDRVSDGRNPDELVRLMTSGSTGEPMPVLRMQAEEALMHAYQLRSQLTCGVPLRARRAKVGKMYRAGILHRAGLLPTMKIDAARRAPADILEKLVKWRADCLDLRPGVLEPLVEEAERQGRSDWPWRWVVSGGEMLYRDLRRRAERAFGARMLERYGAHEVGQIAWACPECGLFHTNDDSVLVEIVRDGKTVEPGETGEVLVTGLLSFAMPVLRFPLGDLARRTQPRRGDCRIGFGSIGAVEGRLLDNLMLADGRSIPTYGLMSALRETPGLLQFQVVQESFDRIRVRCVTAPVSIGALEDEVKRRAASALAAPMAIIVERAETIEPEASGKYRYIRGLTAKQRWKQL